MSDGALNQRVDALERLARAHGAALAEHSKRLEAVEAERDQIDRQHDPRAWRRRKLRHARRSFYPGLSRDGAARALALDWRAWAEARSNAAPAPGTRDAVFEELAAGGCTPLGHRTIFDELDEALHR